jgi:hypothetical protein
VISRHPEPDDSRYDDETLLDGIATRERYGGHSHMWLRRQMQKNGFPKPIYIGPVPHWRLGQLRRWEDGLPTTPPPAQVALGVQGVEVLREARARKKAQGPAPPPKPTGRKPRAGRPKIAAE